MSSVEHSSSPPIPTVVERFIPPTADRARYVNEGMRDLASRRVVFQCLEAFKLVSVSSISATCDANGCS